MKLWLYKFYRKIRRRYLEASKYKFEKRIRKRIEEFWVHANDLDQVNLQLTQDTPLDKWKNIRNWQRRLSNKLNAKEFAQKNGCRVSKIYWYGNEKDFSRFDFRSLPENYIIKPIPGHSSKNVFLMRNEYNLFDSKYYSVKSLRKKILKLFEDNPQLHILFEEFIPDEENNYVVPNDYRFYTFNGKIAFIQLDKRKGFKKDQVSFYTENWELIRKKILVDASIDQYDRPPIHFQKMLEDVKRLSAEYKNFVRIDFYSTHEGPVFGEFTPTPRKGKDITRYGNRELIKMWEKHCKGLI